MKRNIQTAIDWTTVATPLGLVALAASERGLCFLQFGDHEADLTGKLRAEFPSVQLNPWLPGSEPLFDPYRRALDGFFEGKASFETVPLDWKGTDFQTAVWRFLKTIPRGKTVSYSDVAAAIGRPQAVRAVGSACGRNTLALAVPCHRVVRGDGQLGGYRWGLERKQRLLETEQGPR